MCSPETRVSLDVYDAELERMNAAMSAENQALLNDNRQLSALIREYEQTLESVMATFRTRAVSPIPWCIAFTYIPSTLRQ